MQLHKFRHAFSRASLLFVGATLLLVGSASAVNQLTRVKADILPNDQIVLVTLKVAVASAGSASVQDISTAQSEFWQSLDGMGVETVRNYSNIPVVVLKVNSQSRSFIEARALEADSLVEGLQENEYHKPALTQVAIRMNVAPVHSAGYDGTDQAVAVLDTGVEASHPFLADKVIREACFSGAGVANDDMVTTLCPGGVNSVIGLGSASPATCTSLGVDCAHGTHVAGIVAGSGGPEGMKGIAPGASIIAVQVFTKINDAGYCSPGPSPCILTSSVDYISGLNHILGLADDDSFTTPIAAVNMSLGGGKYTSNAACDAANVVEKTAIDALRARGIVTIIASANDGFDDGIGTPACISTAVAVGSTNDVDGVDAGFCGDNAGGLVDTISCFTNSEAGMLDLLAPGALVNSSILGGLYYDLAGTSMAAPAAAGAWAILKQLKPNANVDTILGALTTSGTMITRSSSGESFPLINVGAAYNLLNVPGVTINQSGGSTAVTEGGATDTFTVVLEKAPTAQVDIALVTDNNQATLDDTAICFRATAAEGCNKWDNPITITVTANNDAVAEANTTTILTANVTSEDTGYNGISVATVNITTHDNDTEQTPPSGGCNTTLDTDCDGVPNSTEGSTDANGDGIADSTQNNIATIQASSAGKPVSLVVTGVTAGCNPAISKFASLSEDSYGSTDQADFPLGLNDFTIVGCSSGATVGVKVIYDTKYPGARKFYKVTKSGGKTTITDISSSVAFAVETIGGKQVTTVSYPITDGGNLDQDGVANGTIVDPSGVGVAQGAGIASLQDTGGVSNLINTLVGSTIIAVGLYVGIQSMRKNNRKLVYSISGQHISETFEGIANSIDSFLQSRRSSYQQRQVTVYSRPIVHNRRIDSDSLRNRYRVTRPRD